MPREVSISVWCDPCYKEGVSTPAEEVTAALADLARFKPQVALLCERHRKEIYEPMRELMEEFGTSSAVETKPTSARSRRGVKRANYGPFAHGQWECPYPGCGLATLNDKEAVQKHMRAKHATTLGDFMSGQAAASPVAVGRGHATDAMPLRNIPEEGAPVYCPVAGCSQSRGDGRKPAKNKRSLATHMRARHNMALGEWFREHPEVDPKTILAAEGGEE